MIRSIKQIISKGVIVLLAIVSMAAFNTNADTPPHNQESIYEWIARGKSLSRKEIKAMSAEEFIGVLKKHTLVWIGKDEDIKGLSVNTEIPGWPSKNDIPYLLSQLDNKERCAKMASPVFSTIPTDFTTVGEQALYLLAAIKQGEYSLGVKREDKESLIRWAKQEPTRMWITNTLLVIFVSIGLIAALLTIKKYRQC
ncbi:MAG: hypothetical protein KJ017_05135 [Alphaproteobacteria bacterium]|nr:hypothetical protein [Alphaproteobacteria bacterium]